MDRPGLLDPAQVARLNGGDWLHVLATTRLGENELHGAHRDRSFLAVDELAPDDALALIESYQPGGRFRSEAERDAAREIVRLLGSFTLAVESAAVYLGQFAKDVTCAAFLARLKKEGLEGLDTAASQSTEGVLHGEKRLSATLQPTLERLGAAEKLALEFAALLPPDKTPLPWLRALVSKTFSEMERDAEPGYPDPWKNVLRRLFSLRLLQATSVMDADGQPLVVRVHRLVQQLMLCDCPAKEHAERQQIVDELVDERARVFEKTTNWVEARWELEPLDALASLWDEMQHPQAAWLLSHAGVRWHHLAEWSRAEPLLRRALTISEKSLGTDHPTTASALNYLASLLKDTNRLVEAELLVRRELAICEQRFGPEHSKVATSLNNLAQLLEATNRLTETEPLLRRALAIYEQSFGSENLYVARVLNNLATLYYNTNRLGEAEPLLRRVVSIDKQNYGPEHPEVATSLTNLATLLQATNRLAEAEPLMRQALTILDKNLGVNHPTVALALNNFAQLLKAMNRQAEAEPLMRQALTILEKNLGADHPTVALALNNYAQLLNATNRLAEAEPLMRRSLEIFLKFTASTGHQHPHLEEAIRSYGTLLSRMGRSPTEVQAKLNSLTRPYGLLFGNG